MFRTARVAVIACGIALSPAPAIGDQYWVAYEGNDFPENEGWERHYYAPQPSIRTVADGVLQMDSSADQMTYDFSQIHRLINPTLPDELFIAEWRVEVTSLESPFDFGDTGLGIARDGGGILDFSFMPNRVESDREGWSISVSPGIPHDYRIISTNMLTYALEIDGQFAGNGVWDLNSLNESFIGWGDTTQGGGILSISTWDYVRFGVVPEPSAVLMVLVAIAQLCASRRLRT